MNEALDVRGETRVYKTLSRLAACLHAPVERTRLDFSAVERSQRDGNEADWLLAGARQMGIQLKEAEAVRLDEIFALVREGYPVVAFRPGEAFVVIERASGRQWDISLVDERVTSATKSTRSVRKMLTQEPGTRFWVAKRELECDSLSSAVSPSADPRDSASHAHPTPLRRFLELLRLDSRDIWTIALFALVAGILALATPLAIESLVNVVSWGTYLQPLLVLAFMLLACLGLAGILRILQTVVVEIIQQRQMVRIVGDLAHRFPRANQASLLGVYPRELANRVFDIMTIQKATAVLLLDGIGVVLATAIGLLLLAFYHPFLLGFDIVLVISMISITWLLGRGGVRTAIDESVVKYRIAHWLQDVLASPSAFKINGGESLAIERANRLAANYIDARQDQFRVVIRQVAFAIGLQAIALTALLGLGGWLVIQRQLTLGQLVASELVVTVVVGAFAKAGKSLEKYYDLMAGIDKVGHLLDVPVDPRYELGDIAPGPAGARWNQLRFHEGGMTRLVPAAKIAPGARVAICGDDIVRRSLLARTLAGLIKPQEGVAEIAGFESQQAAVGGAGQLVGYAGPPEVFRATLQENVDLGRSGIGQNRVREALQAAELWQDVLRLPEGLQSMLQTGGHPWNLPQCEQLMIARAMAGQPRFLILDHSLDHLTPAVRASVWRNLAAEDAPWTLLVVTNHQEIADLCAQQIELPVTDELRRT